MTEFEDFDVDLYSDEGNDDENSPEAQYYEAKGALKEDNEEDDALEMFQNVIELEAGNKTEWGFRAYKRIVQIYIHKKQKDKVQEFLKKFLEHSADVSPNIADRSVIHLLDDLQRFSPEDAKKIFADCADHVKNVNNRLWFSVMIYFARFLFKKSDNESLKKCLYELHDNCRNPDGSDDRRKASHLTEIYSMRIRLALEAKEYDNLSFLCLPALSLSQDVIMTTSTSAALREGCGVLRASQGSWKEAASDFFKAFMHYDEEGNAEKRIFCLKCVVLTNVLATSKFDVDPLLSVEIRPYRDAPEIKDFHSLFKAFDAKDPAAFFSLMEKLNLEEKDFFKVFAHHLYRHFRVIMIRFFLSSYSIIRIATICQLLRLDVGPCEDLVIDIISNNNNVNLVFDQKSGVIKTEKEITPEDKKIRLLNEWAVGTLSIQTELLRKFIE